MVTWSIWLILLLTGADSRYSQLDRERFAVFVVLLKTFSSVSLWTSFLHNHLSQAVVGIPKRVQSYSVNDISESSAVETGSCS